MNKTKYDEAKTRSPLPEGLHQMRRKRKLSQKLLADQLKRHNILSRVSPASMTYKEQVFLNIAQFIAIADFLEFKVTVKIEDLKDE